MSVSMVDVTTLKEPVWFDTGLKMQDGSPRLVAAYDTKELNEYRTKESPLGTFTDLGDYKVEDTAKWKPVSKVPDMKAPNTVPGITTSKVGRPKKNG